MRKLIFLIAFCFCGLMSQSSFAQISFSLNISSQPIWGPVGYDHVEYYYLPDIGAYYYVPTRMFFFLENGRWISRPYLYGRYRDFDLFRARKVVINEPRPYLRDRDYRVRYANRHVPERQMLIRDSHDSRYFEIKEHPEHSKWRGNNGNENNRGNGNKKDNRNQGQGRGRD